VTAFAVSASGALTRLQSFASPGANEVAISPDGEHLYVSDPGPGTISVFSIGNDGLLTALPSVTSLPTGLAGIAAS
jgi:6-phosphogluconolactonase (cycloisomerase 2 family)